MGPILFMYFEFMPINNLNLQGLILVTFVVIFKTEHSSTVTVVVTYNYQDHSVPLGSYYLLLLLLLLCRPPMIWSTPYCYG